MLSLPHRHRTFLKKRLLSRGASLIELLIVVAIIAVLIVLGLQIYQRQLSRSRDAQRKDDLHDIKTAFEDYYTDNQCYPPATALGQCESESLKPYLRAVPCDPQTKQPYVYTPLPDGSGCQGYRVLTTLENEDDPAVKELKCDPTQGCGGGAGTNYGVSEGVPVSGGEVRGGESPSPSGPGWSVEEVGAWHCVVESDPDSCNHCKDDCATRAAGKKLYLTYDQCVDDPSNTCERPPTSNAGSGNNAAGEESSPSPSGATE